MNTNNRPTIDQCLSPRLRRKGTAVKPLDYVPPRRGAFVALLLLFLGNLCLATPHKVRVSDPELSRLLISGGGKLVADYGSFQVIEMAATAVAVANADPQIELEDEYNLIKLQTTSLDTTTPQVQSLRKTTGAFLGKHLHLIQFAAPIKPEWRAGLEKAGVEVVSYIPENAYMVYGDAAALARAQAWAGSGTVVQWDGPYVADYKIHLSARLTDANGNARAIGTDEFGIQLIADPEANAATLRLINQLKLAPIRQQYRMLNYYDIVVSVPADHLADIAAQPDVISIHPYFVPKMLDERQDQIVAGNLSGTSPSGPGYLDWLKAKGFTQAQFNASGFSVDVSDSGIDNGTLKPGHFGLYPEGNVNLASRVKYSHLVGKMNPGSTLAGCSGHGNLNAHIVAGYDDFVGFPFTDPDGFSYGLGVCPFALVGSSVIFDSDSYTFPNFPQLQTAAYNGGARISNNSWGANIDGAYDQDSQVFDALVRTVMLKKSGFPMVDIFAAGNDGPGAQTVGSPASAKNIFCIGASENVRSMTAANGGNDPYGYDGCATSDADANSADDIASFSSRGPCSDGRIKPDLVAPGTHVTGGVAQVTPPTTNGTGRAIACFDATSVCGLQGGGATGDPDDFFPLNQQFYTESTGTSHSAPAVSGACALLRQYFINENLATPSAAMSKAFLMNSARYLTGVSANDTLMSPNQGIGELNLGMALDGVPRILRDQVSADILNRTGQYRTFNGTIADSTKPFRVTIVWTDDPGSTATSKELVNDLDLTVTVGGNTYKGNVFSGPNSVTGGSRDSLNNVESVFLPAGVSGGFTAAISAASITSDGIVNGGIVTEQDFALVVYNATPIGLPYLPAAATYSGLFYESNGVQFQTSGALSVATTTKGSYSGSLLSAGAKYSFTGTFGANGLAINSISRKGTNALTLTLQMNTADNNSISGTVTDGAWVADVWAGRAPFGKSNLSPLAGNYTVVFPGPGDGNPLVPQGDSYGTLSVSTAGLIKFSGLLADGSKVTQSASLVGQGLWPLYVPLYSGKGQILGWLNFTNSTIEDLDGTAVWTKLPASTTKQLYPAGFQFATTSTGSGLIQPASSSASIVNIVNGSLILTGSDLNLGITNGVTVGAKSAVTDDTLVNKLKMTITAKQGSFKGTIVNPANQKPVSFSGVILPKQNSGSGYFLGTSQSGRVILEP